MMQEREKLGEFSPILTHLWDLEGNLLLSGQAEDREGDKGSPTGAPSVNVLSSQHKAQTCL